MSSEVAVAHPAAERRFVLHADDFGMNEPVTRGIIAAFDHGSLTSTSGLANSPFFSQAISFWKNLQSRLSSGDLPSADARKMLGDHPVRPFDFGVHLNLTQGHPVTGSRYPVELLTPSGEFPGIGPLFRRLLASGQRYRVLLKEELAAQIAIVRDHGVGITHLNGHQYVELIPAVAQILPELLEEFQIPVIRVAHERRLLQTTLFQGDVENFILAMVKGHYARRLRRRMLQEPCAFPAAFFGTSHAARVNHTLLDEFLTYAPSEGVTEIGLHPGNLPGHHTPTPTPAWEDPLEALRVQELQFLTSPDCFQLLREHRVRLGRLSSLSHSPSDKNAE